MQQQLNSREQAIISLDFNTKVKLAWQLGRARGLPYFALFSGILLLIVILQTGIYIAKLNPLFQIIPALLYLGLFATCLGVCKSALLYMDGKETAFRWATIFEPASRPASTLPLIAISTLLYLLTQLQIFTPLSNLAALGLTILGILPLLLLEYHYYYAAEHTFASALEILTRPFKLIKVSPKIWLSGCAGYGLSYLVMLIACFPAGIVVSLVDMFSNPNIFFSFESQGYFNFPAMIASSGSPIQLAARGAYLIFTHLLAAAAMVFNTFIFAIAYKQSVLISSMNSKSGA